MLRGDPFVAPDQLARQAPGAGLEQGRVDGKTRTIQPDQTDKGLQFHQPGDHAPVARRRCARRQEDRRAQQNPIEVLEQVNRRHQHRHAFQMGFGDGGVLLGNFAIVAVLDDLVASQWVDHAHDVAGCHRDGAQVHVSREQPLRHGFETVRRKIAIDLDQRCERQHGAEGSQGGDLGPRAQGSQRVLRAAQLFLRQLCLPHLRQPQHESQTEGADDGDRPVLQPLGPGCCPARFQHVVSAGSEVRQGRDAGGETHDCKAQVRANSR